MRTGPLARLVMMLTGWLDSHVQGVIGVSVGVCLLIGGAAYGKGATIPDLAKQYGVGTIWRALQPETKEAA